MDDLDGLEFNEDDESYSQENDEDDNEQIFYNQQLENIICFLESRLDAEDMVMVSNTLYSLCYLIHDTGVMKGYNKGFEKGYHKGLIKQLTEFGMD